MLAAIRKLYFALENIIAIGKRDMTNPKYDGYFEVAKEALKEAGSQMPPDPLTIKCIMGLLKPGTTYDTAIPIEWSRKMTREMNIAPGEISSFVWLYDEKNRIHGRPFNYKVAYLNYLLTNETDAY